MLSVTAIAEDPSDRVCLGSLDPVPDTVDLTDCACAEAIAPLLPTRPLGAAPRGFTGHVQRIHAATVVGGRLTCDELELRLIEMGFVEGAPVRILHQGLFGRDPIAVRVAGATVALRRREAMAVHVA